MLYIHIINFKIYSVFSVIYGLHLILKDAIASIMVSVKMTMVLFKTKLCYNEYSFTWWRHLEGGHYPGFTLSQNVTV